jgi:hypothetical protein
MYQESWELSFADMMEGGDLSTTWQSNLSIDGEALAGASLIAAWTG